MSVGGLDETFTCGDRIPEWQVQSVFVCAKRFRNNYRNDIYQNAEPVHNLILKCYRLSLCKSSFEAFHPSTCTLSVV